MEHRARNTDRADTMRELPQAASRGQAEVLQQSLRIESFTQDCQAERGRRGHGNDPRDQIGLTDECAHCGGPLPEGSTVRREYCSQKCRRAALYALESQARAEARKGRVCPECGRAVPDHLDGRAIYCSYKCGKRANNAYHRRKREKTCEHCGSQYFAHRDRQKYCSRRCRNLARYRVK